MPRQFWSILVLGVVLVLQVNGVARDIGEDCSAVTDGTAGCVMGDGGENSFCTAVGNKCKCRGTHTFSGVTCLPRATCLTNAECNIGTTFGAAITLTAAEQALLRCFVDPGQTTTKRCTSTDDLPFNPMPEGFVGGYCKGTSEECCDKNAECDKTMDMNKVCKCKTGYAMKDGICVKDGDVGQDCADGVAVGTQCGKTDKAATCKADGSGNTKCECIDDHTLVGSMCVPNGRLGGCCDGDNKTMCTGDKYAQCNTMYELCECKTGSSPMNGMCVPNGSPGGLCNNGACPNDILSLCQSPLTNESKCECVDGTTLNNGACVENERVNAMCAASDGMRCAKEKFGICMNKMCVCAAGTHAISGSCVRDNTAGGLCNMVGESCTNDKYAECMSVDVGKSGYGMCMCRDGSSLYSGFCRPDGRVNGKCISGACTHDKYAMCVGDWCQCKDGSMAIGGWCRPNNKAGGYCSTADNTTCSGDKFAHCISNMCMCKTNSTNFEGMCRRDGTIGARCCQGQCFAKNSICTNNMCMCETNYSQIDGKCKTASGIASRLADTNN